MKSKIKPKKTLVSQFSFNRRAIYNVSSRAKECRFVDPKIFFFFSFLFSAFLALICLYSKCVFAFVIEFLAYVLVNNYPNRLCTPINPPVFYSCYELFIQYIASDCESELSIRSFNFPEHHSFVSLIISIGF